MTKSVVFGDHPDMKQPRNKSTYRGARRNAWRQMVREGKGAQRKLPWWRRFVWK